MAFNANKVTAAGLYKCELKTAAGTTYQIKAAQSLSSTPDSQVTEIEGDDTQLSSFTFTKGQEITLQINGISIDAIQALTGNSYLTSSASKYVIPFGTNAEVAPPFFELKGYTRAKDDAGVSGTVIITYLKCQIQGGIEVTEEFQGAFSIQVTIKAFQTDRDIAGAAISGLSAGEQVIYTMTVQ